MKLERFFARVYFSNETVSQTTVSTGPMKMFCLGRETMNVCQRNVTHFGHVECMFDKVKDVFQGFGSLVLKVSKLTYRIRTPTPKALVVRFHYFFLIFMRMFSS